MIRNNWTKEEIGEIYNLPVLELIYNASVVHREFHSTGEVQVCTLLSVKTGGCPEDCAYCPQAARYSTDVEAHKLLEFDEVITKALIAKENGSTRFCMGAAWRNVKDNKDFDNVLQMVKGVAELDLEVCCTLGMLSEDQAHKLKEAGLYAYNHNLDSGEEFYEQIITTRKYDDRLETINNVQKANRVSVWEMVRMIATARILMPKAMVRLSAGRNEMSIEEQALCFMAGANSIFAGDKLLTTPNPEVNEDKKMFELLGLKPREAYKGIEVSVS